LKLEDWHTHNDLCRHAIGKCEDYITKAIELSLTTIGLSDHFPYGYLSSVLPSINEIPYQEYSMNIEEIQLYLDNLENLKEKYNSKIDVKIAFEIDFFKDHEQTLNDHLNPFKKRLDYILGSVHMLFGTGGIFAFDDRRFLDKYNNYNSIDEIYILYYNTVQEMIKTKQFERDIISHFDLPKKFNKRPIDKENIMNKVTETLELIKKSGLTVEINTSGLRRDVGEQYPSLEIIKLMYELDIPILLGSDAHHPDEIAYDFLHIIDILRKTGYSQLAHYEKRKRYWIEI